ncbi:hypothetical protein [Nitrosovibrio sp. Nv6]|uniref:hypothetical protein n=1 Tax=Nitrosovibrio sp. Nv6 TaxID=1855340 RepID=UPI00115FA133|nr:hypothetical protein [Nitrosovibrio sp. Nv6]
MNRIGDNLLCAGANEEIVRAFSHKAVEYIVIGGLAVAWYCATRQADDMDLLVNPTPENSLRIFQAFASLRLDGHNERFAKPGLQVQLKGMYYCEILTPRKNDPMYSELAEDAVDAKLFDIPVQVASVASLLRMKELAVASAEAVKDKHLRDIALLKARLI